MSDLFTPAALSVSELNALVRSLLEQNLFGLWVAGEVSNLTRAASGHYYFSLKDSRAQVRCALFKNAATRLAAPLKEGDHIEVSGKISLYEARGEFQITVNEVRLKGLGRLYEAYERLKAKLQAEGVFDAERKQPLPPQPQRIGIVTSLAAAALRDVVSTLKRRHSGLAVVVYPTPVQGAGSEQQIAAAINTAGERQEVDVLIVCRGGGSIEDLWAFNEEAVVRAITACPLPVVSGVGHETDFTLPDFVADVRAPTPTAAAELVSPDRAQLRLALQRTQQQWHSRLLQRYYDASQKLDWLLRQLRHPQHSISAQQQQLRQLSSHLNLAMQRQQQQGQQRLAQAVQQCQHLRPNTAQATRQLEQQRQALQQHWQHGLQQRHTCLQYQIHLLDAVSPQHILARGFSVVTNSRGQVVRQAADLKPGQALHIRFAEGSADVRVNQQAQTDLFD